ncbi:MAG: hypothetical protein PHQ52_02685, partial [Candidatus Omnitrophica bacterium]|nr:hypothetical protein [Candidatus Omnitrophota bacterium]
NRSVSSFNSYNILSAQATASELDSYKSTLTLKTDFLNNIIDKKVFISIVLSNLGSVLGFNSWIDKIVFNNNIKAAKVTDVRVRGAVYGSAEEGLAEINKIVENIKNNAQIMEFFTATQIKTAKSKKFFEEEITEFEIVLQ